MRPANSLHRSTAAVSISSTTETLISPRLLKTSKKRPGIPLVSIPPVKAVSRSIEYPLAKRRSQPSNLGSSNVLAAVNQFDESSQVNTPPQATQRTTSRRLLQLDFDYLQREISTVKVAVTHSTLVIEDLRVRTAAVLDRVTRLESLLRSSD